jgi:hypothetical protein
MAGSADSVGIAVVEREERVVRRWQRGRDPRRRGMARSTCGRPARGHVVGIRRPREIRLVARIAVSRRTGEDVVYMTQIARDRRMRTGEWERRVVVIERRSGPICRRVAGAACCWESRSRVARIRRSIPVGLMAAIAGGRQRCVVVVRVAGRACDSRMESR